MGLVHNLFMQVFNLEISKTQVSENYFFDKVTTHNDHPSYVKHVLGIIYLLFRGWGRGGMPSGYALLAVDFVRGGFAEGN